MKIKLILLIILSLAGFATSQSNFNISVYDSQLRDIFNGLIETEKKIGNFLSNLSNFVSNVAENSKSNKSRHCLDLSHLQLDLQLQGSIGNFESYQQLTGCENVASKISEIDVDLKKFGDFMDRLELNMTELYHRNLYVTYDFILYRKLQTSQQDILDIILGVNEATIQYLNYILQLQVNIQYEKSIATNLKLFMTNFCKCNDNPSDVAKMTENLPNSNNLASVLAGKQAKVASAANQTLIEFQKIGTSKNMTGKLKILTSEVSNLCRKLMKTDDFSNIPDLATNSCSVLSKNQNFLNYRKFQYIQILSFVSTSTAVLEIYKKVILDCLLVNQSLNSAILGLNSSLYSLGNEMKKYAVELRYQLSSTGLSSIIRQNKHTIETFCGCSTFGAGTKTTIGLSTTISSKLSTTNQNQATNLTTFGSTTKNSATTSSAATKSSQSLTTTANPTSNSPSTLKTQPSLPPTASTTILAPFSNPACSYTKILTDYNGTYIKTACLMETASNATYANSSCQTSSMQLMTVDSNMTQTALTIFVQETLSEGTFWISGVNGTEMCKLVTVNETGLRFGQDYCDWYNYYSICEYVDPKVSKKVNFEPNLDACGLIFPIKLETDKESTKFACVMAYTRSYINSDYNCMLNGMTMFNIAQKSVLVILNDYLVSFYGNNSGILMWINATVKAGSCAFLDGNQVPFAVAGGNCDQLYWSVCDTPFDERYSF